MRPREVTNGSAGIFLSHLALFVVMWRGGDYVIEMGG